MASATTCRYCQYRPFYGHEYDCPEAKKERAARKTEP